MGATLYSKAQGLKLQANSDGGVLVEAARPFPTSYGSGSAVSGIRIRTTTTEGFFLNFYGHQ